MSVRSFGLSIIIPTKNRVQILIRLLKSISQFEELKRLGPQVLIADNDSQDNTSEVVKSLAVDFPTAIGVIKVARAGKSAAINDAARTATGNVLAFLDDDVVVDKTWLVALENFFRDGKYQAGQGVIRLQSPAMDDPEILKLVQRYRTIPKLEHEPIVETVNSLNGANMFITRDAFDRVGGFDERLGPGASGTSEDVDFARRLGRAGISIGYAPQAVVYHRVDRGRLTEEYFAQVHRRQGGSRLLFRRRGAAGIFLNLARATSQYVFYTLIGKERNRYRSKGRIYHYLGMIDAKRNGGQRQRAR